LSFAVEFEYKGSSLQWDQETIGNHQHSTNCLCKILWWMEGMLSSMDWKMCCKKTYRRRWTGLEFGFWGGYVLFTTWSTRNAISLCG